MTKQKEETFSVTIPDIGAITFHVFEGNRVGMSIWRAGKLLYFGETPWIKGHVFLGKPPRLFKKARNGVEKTLTSSLLESSLGDAIVALETGSLDLLCEAVATVYMTQLILGAYPLENINEAAKVYADNFALYLFMKPELVPAHG